MFFPPACHKQYTSSKSRICLSVSLSRAIWTKCFFLLMVDVGKKDEGSYRRARKVIGKVSGWCLTMGKFSMVSVWVWLLTLYMHKYWKYTKGKTNINSGFILHVAQNCQANITADLPFLIYRCFLMTADSSQYFTVEVTLASGFDDLHSCRQFTWWQVLPAKQPGLHP